MPANLARSFDGDSTSADDAKSLPSLLPLFIYEALRSLPVGHLPLSVAEVRSAVLAHYPKARESALPPKYLWVYVNGEWVLWCFATTTFLVDVAPEGDVLITLEEWQPLI